jgi:hypothetical protein
MDVEEIKALEEEHVIGHYAWVIVSQSGEKVYKPAGQRDPVVPLEKLQERGTIQGFDRHYKEILGI